MSIVKILGGKRNMTLVQKRILILIVVAIIGIILGRLAFRAFINLMVGGSLFGGNFL
jgi:hypothetical protein